MTDPFAGEFDDVLAALQGTELAMPTTATRPLPARDTERPAPERLDDLAAVLERDGDEAWSLARTFLGDADAAWDALVSGFVTIARGGKAVTAEDSLVAVARAAQEVARLLAKADALPEGHDARLAPDARLALLLQVGLGVRGLDAQGLPALERLLPAAFPQPSHPGGAELGRLLARELLDALSPADAERLAQLAQAHPTRAALLRERYAELADVPPLILADRGALLAQVQAQLEQASAREAEVGAVQLRISVRCSYCHDGLDRAQAAFCGACLAPHHADCFQAHGRCSAPGCEHTQLVRAVDVEPAPRRRRRVWPWTLILVGAGAAAALLGQGEPARSPVTGPSAPLETGDPAPRVRPDPLAEARRLDAQQRAEREAERARNEAVANELEGARIDLDFDETPFLDCVAVLRERTQQRIIVSPAVAALVEAEQLTVNLRLRGITQVNALRLVLAAHEHLDSRIESGVIVIQVHDEGGVDLWLEAYEVSDLLDGRARQRGGFALDGDLLIELTEPLVGDEGLGSANLAGGTLVFNQPAFAHTRVQRLLTYLRTGEGGAGYGRPAWVDDLKQKLARPLTANFEGIPLAAVVAYVQDVTGANVTLAPGVDGDALVSLPVDEIPAFDALELLADQTGLTLAYANETLQLADGADLQPDYYLRLIDVTDLSWLQPDELEALVENAVGADAWNHPAWLRVHRMQLIVNQDPRALERIDDVLAKLRLSKARPEGELPQPPR